MIEFIKKNKKTLLFLTGIFAVALILRTVFLSSFPVGFQIDEASLGYNAYSLLKTGKSESGAFLPLYVNTFGDFNPIGYDYIATIPVAIFGLTVFATRLPAAIFGALTIFAVYYLVQVLFNDKKLSLLSCFLVAVSPWHVIMSRASAETLVALFFVVLGFAFVLSFISKYKLRNLLLGNLMLFTSFFIYPAPRVFVPLLFLILIVYFYKTWWKDKKYKISLFSSFIFLVLSIIFLVFVTPGGTARFRQTSIFNFPTTKLLMEEQIREDGMLHVPNLLTRLNHNKVVDFSLTFAGNYLEYFSGVYLFVEGGKPFLLSIPSMGLVYLVELPFILIGVVRLVNTKGKMSKVPLIWLVCAPVVAALTVDDSPNVRRSIMMIPALEILAAAGVLTVVSWASESKKKLLSISWGKIVVGLVALLFIFNISYFLHEYFVNAQVHKTWYRNNGFGKMMELVNKNYDKFDKVILTKQGGGYPLVLFYSKFDPQTYINEGSHGDTDYKGFGKFIFIPKSCPSVGVTIETSQYKNVLYVDMGSCSLPGRPYTDVRREDGSLGFRVVY